MTVTTSLTYLLSLPCLPCTAGVTSPREAYALIKQHPMELLGWPGVGLAEQWIDDCGVTRKDAVRLRVLARILAYLPAHQTNPGRCPVDHVAAKVLAGVPLLYSPRRGEGVPEDGFSYHAVSGLGGQLVTPDAHLNPWPVVEALDADLGELLVAAHVTAAARDVLGSEIGRGLSAALAVTGKDGLWDLLEDRKAVVRARNGWGRGWPAVQVGQILLGTPGDRHTGGRHVRGWLVLLADRQPVTARDLAAWAVRYARCDPEYQDKSIPDHVRKAATRRAIQLLPAPSPSGTDLRQTLLAVAA